MLVAMVCDNFWNSASDLAPVLTPPGVYCDALIAKTNNWKTKIEIIKSSNSDKDKRDK